MQEACRAVRWHAALCAEVRNPSDDAGTADAVQWQTPAAADKQRGVCREDSASWSPAVLRICGTGWVRCRDGLRDCGREAAD